MDDEDLASASRQLPTEEIHDKIDAYARLGWPDTTPPYAVRDYPGMLAAAGDATRLSALARDPRRHAFLLRATGSDYAALAEIEAAQRLVAGRDEPDLQALVELAVYRNAISLRNQCLPFALPGVWARLGRLDHAAALARAIPDPDFQVQSLGQLASAAVLGGDADRASRLATEVEAVARTITVPYYQARALDELAKAAAEAGDPDRASRLVNEAEALARTITDEEDLGWVLMGLASAAAMARSSSVADRSVGLVMVVRASASASALSRDARSGSPASAATVATSSSAAARASGWVMTRARAAA